MAWDDILAELGPEETDKPVLEKYRAKIENGYLRQSDYSRQMNDMKGKVELANQWDEWAKQEWDSDLKMTKTAAQIKAEAEQLRTRVAELEAGTNKDMTWEEIEKGLNTKGYVKADALKDVVRKTDYEGDVEKRFGNRDAAIEHLFSEVTPLMLDYKEKFGKHMDAKRFLRFIGETKERFLEPRKAFDEFIASDSERAALEAEKSKFEAQKKDFEEAQRKATEAAATKTPVDTGEGLGANRFFPNVQRTDKGELDLDHARLGDGTLAAEGARLLREGKLTEMVREAANQ